VAEADAALLIANHHEGSKRHAAATLHGLGNAVDVDEAIDEFAIDFLATFRTGFSCHDVLLLARVTHLCPLA
jgi:hypothetical protein